MRTRSIAIAALVITGLGVPLVAGACNDRPNVSACRVIIFDDHLVATFPIFKAPTVWRWSRASTEDNALEYRWLVEFGACSNSGIFEKQELAIGVQLFKWPEGKERSGSFTDLLKQAQADLLRREQKLTGVSYARVEGVRISGDYQTRSGSAKLDSSDKWMIEALSLTAGGRARSHRHEESIWSTHTARL